MSAFALSPLEGRGDVAIVIVNLRDGQTVRQSLSFYRREEDQRTKGEVEERLVVRALVEDRSVALDPDRPLASVRSWRIKLIETGKTRGSRSRAAGEESSGTRSSTGDAPPHAQKVARCRSVLRAASLLLPRSVRDEELDEWMDEIECAAAERASVLKRVLSILFRAVPATAWHSRWSRLPRERRP